MPANKRKNGSTKRRLSRLPVTRSRHSAAKSSQLEHRLELLASKVGQIYISVSSNGITQDSHLWQAFTGQTDAEVAGWGWLNAIHPDERLAAQKCWGHAIAMQTSFEMVFQVRRSDGVYRTFGAHCIPTYNNQGEIFEWVGICSDITAFETIASSQRIGTILESITDAFFTLDRDWHFTYLNSQTEPLLRRSRETLMHRNIWQEFPEAIDTRFYKEYHRAFREQVTLSFVEFYEPFATWFEVHIYPSPEGLSIYFRDVNDRVAAEQRQRELEQVIHNRADRLEAVLNSMSDGVVVYEKSNDTIIDCNPAFRRMIGIPFTEGLPTTNFSQLAQFLQFRNIDNSSIHYNDLTIPSILRGDTVTDRYMLLTAFDGHEIYINLSGTPLRSPNGEITGAVLVGRDVTERIRLERRTHDALQALIDMTRAILYTPTITGYSESRNNIVLMLDSVRDVLACQAVSLLDYADNSMQMSAHTTMMPAIPLPTLTSAQHATLSSGTIVILSGDYPMSLVPLRIDNHVSGVLWLICQDGNSVEQEQSLSYGAAQLVALYLERDRLILERERARAEILALADANSRMDEFLGLASHELRTPLTSLKLGIHYALVYLREQFDQDVQSPRLSHAYHLMGKMARQVERLTSLVNDLLDVSRIQNGELDFTMKAQSPIAIVTSAVEDLQIAHPDRTIIIQESQPALQIWGDDERLEQVLSNLLTNALKYSPADTPVIVQVSTEDYLVCIEITDQGQGIAQADLPYIWDRFYRASNIEVLNGSGVGLGLGLYICRSIIIRHGGQIGVRSEPGQGSTFWFTLPAFHQTNE
jgi:PAS domain S-box-containing protein